MPTLREDVYSAVPPVCAWDEPYENRFQFLLTHEFKRGKRMRRHRYEELLKDAHNMLERYLKNQGFDPIQAIEINRQIKEILNDGTEPGFFDKMIVCSGDLPDGTP